MSEDIAWRNFEKETAVVLDAKLTRASGRLSQKGDSQSDLFINESKCHKYKTKSGRFYTIIKDKWFVKLIKEAIRCNKIPILSVSLGPAHLYFVLHEIAGKDSGKLSQGENQVTIHADELDEILGKTVVFGGEKWTILSKNDIKDIISAYSTPP